jgi:hypothetical protein
MESRSIVLSISSSRTGSGWIALAVAVAVAGIFAAFCAYAQPLIAVADGRGWDGVHYVRMAEQATQGIPPSVPRPFSLRPALPFLIGVAAPHAPLGGFRWFNLTMGVCSAGVLAALLRRNGASPRATALLTGIFILHPVGPIRFSALYPAHVDPPALVFMWLILLIPSTRRGVWAATVASFTGVLFREAVGAAAIAWTLAHLLSSGERRGRLGALAPIAAVAAGILTTHALAPTDVAGHSFAAQAWTSLRAHLIAPWGLAAALALVFGPLLLLRCLQRNDGAGGDPRTTPLLWWFALSVMPLVLLGGTDTDRFLLWLYPFVAIGCAHMADRVLTPTNSASSLALIAWTGIAILSLRVTGTLAPQVPDATNSHFILFTPVGANVDLMDLRGPTFGKRQTAILLAEYLLAALLLRRLMRPATPAGS